MNSEFVWPPEDGDWRRRLINITRRAMFDIESRDHLQYFLSLHINLWIEGQRKNLEDIGLVLTYGVFDYRRTEEIVYLVSNELFRYMHNSGLVENWGASQAQVDGFYALLPEAVDRICRWQFDALRRELAQYRLKPWAVANAQKYRTHRRSPGGHQ